MYNESSELGCVMRVGALEALPGHRAREVLPHAGGH